MNITNYYIISGSSKGLGFALSMQLLQPGNHLLCMARHTNAQLQVAADAAGVELTQWNVDLAHGATAAQRMAEWLSLQPAAGIASATLINNAAILPTIAPLSDTSSSDIANVLQVGLDAPLQLTAAFLRSTSGWLQDDHGPTLRRVMNISSGLGRNAMASQALYCAAKAGMDHFTRCVALEEAAKPAGARVCAIAPGVIDTDMQHQLRSANPSDFADRARFIDLKTSAKLSSPEGCAAQLLNYLNRPDFGKNPVADIRDLA